MADNTTTPEKPVTQPAGMQRSTQIGSDHFVDPLNFAQSVLQRDILSEGKFLTPDERAMAVERLREAQEAERLRKVISRKGDITLG